MRVSAHLNPQEAGAAPPSTRSIPSSRVSLFN